MDWWNFSDTSFLILFIVVLVAIIVIIALSISFTLINRTNAENNKRIRDESNTSRIYIVDVKHNIVTYFNRTDLRNKRTMDFPTFYSRFHPNDVEKVKNWIFSICEDASSAEEYLEADIVINKGRNSYFSLLHLLYYDVGKGLIHLESHILRYITPQNQVVKVNKRTGIIGVVDRESIAKAINSQKTTTGYTFCIRFFHLKQSMLATDKEERFVSMTLRNEIYPFASSPKVPRQILESDENEVFLFDLGMESSEAALQLSSSITRELNKAIEVNGFEEVVSFSIGIVENSAFYQNFDAIIKEAQSAATFAHQENKTSYLHQSSAVTDINNNYSQYEEEINELLRYDNMRYVFRHIVDVKAPSVYGYFSYVKLYNSSFVSFDEVMHYAYELKKSKEVFSKVSNDVIRKFINETPEKESRLFYSVSMANINDIMALLPEIPRINEIRLVLLFREQEVAENAEYTSILVKRMEEIKSLGFEIALLMKERTLLLPREVYTIFDYYVVGSSLTGEMRKNTRTRLSIATLVEGLLKYHKPIIATDLEGWATIELIIKSGIDLISSEVISYSNEMILPIEKKKLDKLQAIDRSYRQRDSYGN